MPAIEEWLSRSWRDYRARWGALMGVLGLGSALTLLGVFLPLAAGGLGHLFGLPPAPTWIAAGSVATLVGLWLSTWTQAAATRAAMLDETAAASLSEGWRGTPRFAWALTLVLLASGGGFFLLLLPGLLLTVLLFAAPFEAATGESEGFDALERSWARVRPRFGATATRLFVAWLAAAAPAWIPYVGWLIAPLWAPFGLVACARLAADLAAAEPAPERPSGLRAATVVLGLIFLGGGTAASLSAYRLTMRMASVLSSGGALPSEAMARSMLAVLQGQGSEAEKQVVYQYAVSLATAAAAPPPNRPSDP